MAYTEDDSLNRENDFYKAKHEAEIAKENAFYEKHPWAKPGANRPNQNLSSDQFQSGPWNSGGVMYGPPAPQSHIDSLPGAGYRGRGKQFGTSGKRNRDQLSYNAQEGRYD